MVTSEDLQFTIGSDVECTDGYGGELLRVVVDPVARTLTHLVVEPRHRRGLGHLVPLSLVADAAGPIRLRCTTAELKALDDAEETQFLAGAEGPWQYEQDQMLSWPYFPVQLEGARMAGPEAIGVSAAPATGIQDQVPAGEVEVRRGERVHATDGDIGRVRGLLVDDHDHRVTHVLLDEGHLWGEKTVAIPIGAVAGVDDGVRLSLTKDQVRDLPPVDLGQEPTRG